MLLRMSDWKKIREHFSQQEKDELNAAITGETICPRGYTVAEWLAPNVLPKVKKLLEKQP